MQMTSGMLLFCLALALVGVVLLLLVLRGLLRSVRSHGRTNGYLLAAGLIFTVGLLVIDTVVLWCLIEYGLFGSQALQWPVYAWILVGLAALLFFATMRWARRAIAGARLRSNSRSNTTARRREFAP